MKISAAEQSAIRLVLEVGARHGYGNLITHLQTAWAAQLMRSGVSEKVARLSTARDCRGYPCLMQADLLERGEWDETGARYSKPKARKPKRPATHGGTTR